MEAKSFPIFTPLENHLLIHCSSSVITKKLTQYILHSCHTDPHDQEKNIFSLLANVTSTENDIVLSRFPQHYAPQWTAIIADVRQQYSLFSQCSSDESSIDNLTPIIIPTSYTGEDLSETAYALHMTVPDFITWHTGHLWTVAFMGFAPGFAYLINPHSPQASLPRKPIPRAHVAAGSVALAGSYCGIYPHDCPGGWHIIGNTTVPIWNIDHQPPNTISLTSCIQFQAI